MFFPNKTKPPPESINGDSQSRIKLWPLKHRIHVTSGQNSGLECLWFFEPYGSALAFQPSLDNHFSKTFSSKLLWKLLLSQVSIATPCPDS